MLLTFFDNIIFKSLYLLKWCPIFDTSPLTQFSKFNNFLWVCWFFGKNLSDFVPPVWKLHNPYCHNMHWQCRSPSGTLHCSNVCGSFSSERKAKGNERKYETHIPSLLCAPHCTTLTEWLQDCKYQTANISEERFNWMI